MEKSIIAEGKTTNEAIENGLKELKVPKDRVEIKILENEEKRSFFSILAPRVVKVELTLREEKKAPVKPKKDIEISKQDLEKAEENVEKFLKELIKNLPENTQYNIEKTDMGLNVELNGSRTQLGFLIGYRGETLYAMQSILSAIASKHTTTRIRVILDIQGYKEKREKTLKELAQKVAKTVIRTGQPIKLEPMQAYERKIIHSKLQSNKKVYTASVGEEPYRRIVIYPK